MTTCGMLGLTIQLMASAQNPSVAARTKVLFLYAHDPNAPGVVAFASHLKTVVREQIPTLEIYEENLDLDRFGDPARASQLERYFEDKYRRFRPDAIVTEGTQALRFAAEHLRRLFPDVPVVYGIAFEPLIDFSSLPANAVGRRLPLPFASTFSLAHALQPDAERVVVIGGAAWTDSLAAAEARRQIAPLLDRLPLSIYQDWSYEGLLDSLRRFAPRTLVILGDFRRDQAGRELIPGNMISSLANVASVPLYGIARNWIGEGIVGGGVMDFSEDGRRVGTILLRVLTRSTNAPLPTSEVGANSLVVDWRQLQRWHLPGDRLPPDAQILFRPPSVWARYRGVILVVVAVLLLQSVLIGLLLVERRRRARAQQIAQEARNEMEHMARVATMSGLAAAVSHELGQPLTAIRLNAETGARLLSRSPPELEELRLVLQDIVSDDARAAAIIDHFRALVRKEDPVSITVDVNGLCRHVAKLLEHEASLRHARLVLQLDPAAPPVRGDPVQLQQLLINLTLNALDALSGATTPAGRVAAISTLANNGEVEVQVSDTGPGLSADVQKRLFDPFFSTKPHGLGMGLTIVRAIVDRHHGLLRADNLPVGGARFTVTFPAVRA